MRETGKRKEGHSNAITGGRLAGLFQEQVSRTTCFFNSSLRIDVKTTITVAGRTASRQRLTCDRCPMDDSH